MMEEEGGDGRGEDEGLTEVRRNRFHEEFKEADEARQLISSLESIYKDQIAVERCLERFVYIIDQYQEQPHLLNPHLESLVTLILDQVRREGQSVEVIHLSFKLLYLITKTRGYKVMVSLMPHEVPDVVPVLDLIDQQKPDDFQSWETRYELLLWLSMACMIPFDLKRFDGDSTTNTVMDRILNIGLRYLEVTDKSRDASAYMLSHFLTRPDVRREKFDSTLDNLLSRLQTTDLTSRIGRRSASGILLLFASLLKYSQRQDLKGYDIKIMRSVVDKIGGLKDRVDDTLLRKLYVKLIQRIGLNLLPARVAKWRYKRGRRILAETISNDNTNNKHQHDDDNDKDDDDDEFDIPDEIEDIIEVLLSGLKDKDTVVRWSAAKGIGRVTGRLRRDLSDDVVASVMDLFSPLQSDSAWHGGCLTLAELGRRGLLLPDRLPQVVPIVLKALLYDERQGTVSIGSNVRDSACYVCWSFARAYDVHEIKPHVQQIATALVLVSLFDRQINVRRAASAAFQEHVGRQGQFPHGIEILTLCDYFTVSLRSHCYLQLSVTVAGYEGYTLPIIEHLLHVKSSHYDLEIRELTASSLHLLTDKSSQYMSNTAVPVLLKNSLVSDFNTHHGALLSLAHVTHALALLAKNSNRRLEDVISEESLQQIRDLTQKILEQNFVRGSAADPMRKALCCLIEKLSLSGLTFNNYDVINVWQKLLNECLQSVEEDVRAAAVKALPALCNQYYKQQQHAGDNSQVIDPSPHPSHCQSGMFYKYNAERTRCSLLDSYITELSSNIETTRCGFALALGSLPVFMFCGHVTKVLSALITATTVTDKKYRPFAESRRDAVKALTSIIQTLGVDDVDQSESRMSHSSVSRVYKALHDSTNDYTLDSRGDVGAWVREAGMQGLYDMTLLLLCSQPKLFTPNMCCEVFCCLIQQSCEKIDRTRQVAGSLFSALLHHRPEVPHVVDRVVLEQIFSVIVVKEMNWSAPALTFPLFTRLLNVQQYTYSVLLGLTVSCGGITESLVKHAVQCVTDHLLSLEIEGERRLLKCLVSVLRDHIKVDRVTVPLLRMLERLLNNGSLLSLLDHCIEETKVEGDDRGDGSKVEGGVEVKVGGSVEELYELCRGEVRACKDVQKVLVSIDVFCGLAQVGLSLSDGMSGGGAGGLSGGGAVRRQALSQLSLMLCQPYPVVRRTTANKLYELIVVAGEQLVSSNRLILQQQQQHDQQEQTDEKMEQDLMELDDDERLERLTTLLTESLWDKSVEEVRPIRNEICDLLSIPRPVIIKQNKQ